MNIFDPENATKVQQWAADKLESLFSEFPYMGPLVSGDGTPYLLIETDIGDVRVNVLSTHILPVNRVFLQVQDDPYMCIAPGRACMYLREKGAKSDRVPRR
ncbi:hypothetical protein [Kushneria indalinina]|uniref:Uncharacterized protein n=1 Tax=Kushneria indalinina DSM 14324 TaxID=1122140 RepID=A0A3D9DVX8_9GAMM|nr:hypothetical protein [Kushneria indalinina]REC94907.1 hypothetical protein C8D72_1736 [Kushneria indalinina DSM 14324]